MNQPWLPQQHHSYNVMPCSCVRSLDLSLATFLTFTPAQAYCYSEEQAVKLQRFIPATPLQPLHYHTYLQQLQILLCQGPSICAPSVPARTIALSGSHVAISPVLHHRLEKAVQKSSSILQCCRSCIKHDTAMVCRWMRCVTRGAGLLGRQPQSPAPTEGPSCSWTTRPPS